MSSYTFFLEDGPVFFIQQDFWHIGVEPYVEKIYMLKINHITLGLKLGLLDNFDEKWMFYLWAIQPQL